MIRYSSHLRFKTICFEWMMRGVTSGREKLTVWKLFTITFCPDKLIRNYEYFILALRCWSCFNFMYFIIAMCCANAEQLVAIFKSFSFNFYSLSTRTKTEKFSSSMSLQVMHSKISTIFLRMLENINEWCWWFRRGFLNGTDFIQGVLRSHRKHVHRKFFILMST